MDSKGEIIIYKSIDKTVQIEAKIGQESVWLTQAQIANLFRTDRSAISKHIHNIFKTKELQEKSNVQKMHITLSDKPVKFYNLDVIISVGYRVNSTQATQFRIWATDVLRKHLIDGYTINEKRLKEQAHKLEALQRTIFWKGWKLFQMASGRWDCFGLRARKKGLKLFQMASGRWDCFGLTSFGLAMTRGCFVAPSALLAMTIGCFVAPSALLAMTR